MYDRTEYRIPGLSAVEDDRYERTDSPAVERDQWAGAGIETGPVDLVFARALERG